MANKEYVNPWLYNGKVYDGENNEKYSGFVYCIENLLTNKKYIGKKTFWAKRKNPKTKRRKIVESNWRKYYGSSEELLNDLDELGVNNFKRTILRLCETKKEMSYWELHEQIIRNVLVREDYYNSNILGKFWRRDTGEVLNG